MKVSKSKSRTRKKAPRSKDKISPIVPSEPQVVEEPKTVVQVRESEYEVWNESVDVNIYSRFGAGFTLSRACTVGRLVSLLISLPPELRVFDKSEKLYSVVGLVQHCNKTMVAGRTAYHVGVGFVGKEFPDSYIIDPKQNYRVSGTTIDGLWKITEAEAQLHSRRCSRFWLQLEVTISLIDITTKSIIKEQTVTKNLGASGAAVDCALDAKVGDKVKFACRDLDFYAIAVIRNRRLLDGWVSTYHLEFVDARFPVERLVYIGRAVPEQNAAQSSRLLTP